MIVTPNDSLAGRLWPEAACHDFQKAAVRASAIRAKQPLDSCAISENSGAFLIINHPDVEATLAVASMRIDRAKEKSTTVK